LFHLTVLNGDGLVNAQEFDVTAVTGLCMEQKPMPPEEQLIKDVFI